MKLNIREIEDVAKSLVYEEPTDALNTLLVHGMVRDFEFPTAAGVRLQYYRAGQELFFEGDIRGAVVGHCARCLEPYPFQLAKRFSVVLVPKQPLAPEVELRDDQLDLSYYEGEEIDVSPMVHEQIILALPTRPLCREDCKGLCPQCGANLNVESCRCASAGREPRLAVLRNLKIGH